MPQVSAPLTRAVPHTSHTPHTQLPGKYREPGMVAVLLLQPELKMSTAGVRADANEATHEQHHRAGSEGSRNNTPRGNPAPGDCLPRDWLCPIEDSGSHPRVDRGSHEHRDHLGVAQGAAGRRRGGRRLRHHAGGHPAVGHDDGARVAPAGAGRAGRPDQLEQVGGRGARVQQPVRRQAPGAHRRPDRLRPAQLRASSGNRWTSRSTRSIASK